LPNFCSNCGESISDDVKFCPECGAKALVRSHETQPVISETTPAQQPSHPSWYIPPVTSAPVRKEKNYGIYPIIIGIIIILALYIYPINSVGGRDLSIADITSICGRISCTKTLPQV
jgi:uncharacterized membrane protein YvbJ